MGTFLGVKASIFLGVKASIFLGEKVTMTRTDIKDIIALLGDNLDR